MLDHAGNLDPSIWIASLGHHVYGQAAAESNICGPWCLVPCFEAVGLVMTTKCYKTNLAIPVTERIWCCSCRVGITRSKLLFFWVSRFYLACQPHGVAIWTDEGWTTKLALKFDRRPATPRIKRTPQARRKRALAKSAQKPAGKARPRGKATKSAGATKHEDKACNPCLRPGQFIFALADLEKAAASSRQPRAILHSDLCFWRGRFIGGAKGANSSLSPANIYKKNRAWQVCWTFMSPWSWRASCQHLGKFLVRTEHVCRVKLTQTQTRAQTDGCIFKGVVPAFGQNTR